MELSRSPRSKSGARAGGPPLLALAYATAAAALLLVVFQGSVRMIGSNFPGFISWDNGFLVAFHRVHWTGWTSGLPKNGGLITAIDGAPFESGGQLLAKARRLAPGTPISYQVRAGDDVLDYTVPTMRLSALDYTLTFGMYLFTGLAFFAMGALALALRPDLPAARSLAVAMGLVGSLCALYIDHFTTYRFVRVTPLAEAATAAAILQVILIFPVERGSPRRRRLVVALAALLLLGAGALESAAFYERPEFARSLFVGVNALLALLGLGLVASLAEAAVRADDPQHRAQAAVVFAGALAGFMLPAAGILAFAVLGWSGSWTLWVPLLSIFALSLLYAILRHDLLATERFVRLAVGYAFATAVMVLVYAGGLSLLGRLVLPDPEESAAATFALVLAIAISFEPLRRRAQVGIDRAFYQTRVDVAAVLEDSSAQLAGLDTEKDVVGYVARLLRNSLSLQWAELRLQEHNASAAAVVEPVVFHGERLGLIACGPKRSGAPYSSDEHNLVKGLAAQAALALHNLRAIEALREAQMALVRSARLAAVGEFAGAVAHGIRNPLAGIRAAAQVAQQQDDGGARNDALRSVLTEVDRLDQRIRTLLDFSKPTEPVLRSTKVGDLLTAVEQALRPSAARCRVRISVDLPPEPTEWVLDPDYLEEALLELGANALRAMPDGGTLRLGLERADGGIELFVSDTGSGIPEGVRGRVFDLFFTTRPDGTGMGLASVKKIVELHGGTTAVARSGPTGTEFRIRLV